ncbi:hypothetical protein E2562_019333 [Oryza meyeriana var. granulata]|uniref:Uncharacterized protein n=1 Tax=Oryza meyeriana var. granulata TaxID=110450 RepID=A0A6G1C8I7_9ORYZ|nr:hypothetical protein E2562_019333 [Oryza meyeriana var. granulata]
MSWPLAPVIAGICDGIFLGQKQWVLGTLGTKVLWSTGVEAHEIDAIANSLVHRMTGNMASSFMMQLAYM